ncbi:MAG: glycosyltransferase family 39 protein [Anaerolineae bacterium]|nr:glycosyltransferase family 39 protein [Anaerolineae bacterium]
MSGRLSVWAVFGAFGCLCALTLGRGFYSSDGEVMFQTTAALAQRGTLALPPDPGLPQIVAGRGGRYYSKYDPGLPLLAVPFFVAGDRLAAVNHAHRTTIAAISVLLVSALAAAGALAALAALAGRLAPGQTARALLVVASAGLATPLWWYGRVLFPEAVLACALTLAVWLAARAEGSRKGWLLAGAALGAGMLVRASLAIYALPLAWLVLSPHPRSARMRLTAPSPCMERGQAERGEAGGEVNKALSTRSSHDKHSRMARLVWLLAGTVPFAAALLAHNALRFGDPLATGYAGESFSTAPWTGIGGLLLSPGKGVWLYAPPLLLGALLWPRFRREHPALGEFLALAWALALPFYGMWWAWDGGWGWGPRLLVPLLPLSCLPLLTLPARRGWWAAALCALVLGAGLNIAGILSDPVAHYADVATRCADPAGCVAWTVRDAPLVGAVRLLADGRSEPLALFHLAGTGLPRTWSVGALALLIAGALAAGWRLARATSPRGQRHGPP